MCVFECTYVCTYVCMYGWMDVYINHVKSHASSQPLVIHASLAPRPQGYICLMCNKVCKSAPGLKRHIVVHKDLIG